MLRCLLCTVLLLAAGASSETALLVEAEHYTDWLDLAGMYTIGMSFCEDASGEYSVDGLDASGEWIRVPVTIPQTGSYDCRLHCQGLVGETSTVQLALLRGGAPSPELPVEFHFTGVGIGCWYYLQVDGNLQLSATAGQQLLEFRLFTNHLVRLDCLHLTLDESPVLSSSWSEVKAIY